MSHQGSGGNFGCVRLVGVGSVVGVLARWEVIVYSWCGRVVPAACMPTFWQGGFSSIPVFCFMLLCLAECSPVLYDGCSCHGLEGFCCCSPYISRCGYNPAAYVQAVRIPPYYVQAVRIPPHYVQAVRIPLHYVQAVNIPPHYVQPVRIPPHFLQACDGPVQYTVGGRPDSFECSVGRSDVGARWRREAVMHSHTYVSGDSGNTQRRF